MRRILYIIALVILITPLYSIELDFKNNDYNKNYLDVMLPPEQIRAVKLPEFEPLEKAVKEKKLEYLMNTDLLVLVKYHGVSKLYPIKMLIVHEIVNDIFDSDRIFISHCILTGSTVVFKTPEGLKESEFGVSGALYNSNLVMFDYERLGLWSQLNPKAYSGPQKGTAMELLSFSLITLEYAKNNLGQLEVCLGDLHMQDLRKNYATGFSPRLKNYSENDMIVANVNPALLKKDKYHIKKLFVYFPQSNEAYPISDIHKFPELFNQQKGILLENHDKKPMLTMYWFAVKGFYPDAKIMS